MIRGRDPSWPSVRFPHILPHCNSGERVYTGNRMKRLLRLIFLIAVVAGFWWLIRTEGLPQIQNQVQQVADQVTQGVKEADKSVSAPAPLLGTVGAKSTTLSRAGVLQWTNTYRQQNGVKALTIND